tara:strand:+ start:977 stop:1333 length:357 start_codon:yes stop_codon:yes gene_type:complete
MNKEELELRHNLLETDVRVKSGDLEYANTALTKVKKELADINKPKITEEQSVELARQLCGLFNSAMSEIDPSDLDVEFSMDYNNTIVIDCINGLGDMDPPEDEIHEVIASIFNVTIED